MKTKLTKTLLKKYNLSTYHFSKLAGVHQSTVKKYLEKLDVTNEATSKIEDEAAKLKKFNKKWPVIVYCKKVNDYTTIKANRAESNKLDKEFLNFK